MLTVRRAFPIAFSHFKSAEENTGREIVPMYIVHDLLHNVYEEVAVNSHEARPNAQRLQRVHTVVSPVK